MDSKDIERKEFELEIQHGCYYHLGIITIPLIFVIAIIKSIDKPFFFDELSNAFICFIPIILMICSLWLFDYLATAKSNAIIDENGMTVEIIKAGLAVARKKMFYKWDEIKSYNSYSPKGREYHIVFNFTNGGSIDFINKKHDLELYLDRYFAEKKYVRPEKWDDM